MAGVFLGARVYTLHEMCALVDSTERVHVKLGLSEIGGGALVGLGWAGPKSAQSLKLGPVCI